MTRFFVILAHDTIESKLDCVEEKHGKVVLGVLFNSPCKKLVYGATEFLPHPIEEKPPAP